MKINDVVEVEDSTWEKIIEKSKKPVMVMFYHMTCPYCQQMKPYFEGYAEEFKDKVVFARIDVAQNRFVAGRYNVMGVPAFKFFCEGHPIYEMNGSVYPALIKKTVEDGLLHGKNCVEKTTWIDSSITGYQ
jgi:thioredoxin-like negative regulator of GroEL